MDDSNPTQAEHELITTSLQLEQLDENLFRSPIASLWVPSRARGVFGGQVISQALVSATNCVDPSFHAHSLHSYFLLSADPSVPILYYVERTRQGRSFVTRVVKGVQRGRAVFVMMVSFSKLELDQPVAQDPMPPNVLSPEASLPQEEYLLRQWEREKNADRRAFLLELKQEREKSPIQIKIADDGVKSGTAMYWMRARAIPTFEAQFQKCILAYMSDLNFLTSIGRALRSNPANKPTPVIAMGASLDHSLWFYDHSFDCREWVLFVMHAPVAGLGRGVVQGAFYHSDGKMIAYATQEGVQRVAKPKKEPASKL